MRTTDLINLTNNLLAGEILNYEDLEHLFDAVIDDINATLSTKFPSFSEVRLDHSDLDINGTHINQEAAPTEYSYFPDKYIRSVVAKGAAAKFYVEDEEGIQTAVTYQQEYQQALFYMLRDYADFCEEEYKDNVNRGSIQCDDNDFYAGGAHEYETIWNL